MSSLPDAPVVDESLVTDQSSVVPSIASVSVGEVVGNAIPLRPSSRRIKFLIEWREKTIPIVLDDSETIGNVSAYDLYVFVLTSSLHTSLVAHQARAYPGFCSIKRLGVFLLPPGWDASPSQGYPQQ